MVSSNHTNDSIKACIKVAACVCGKDGIISSMEEQEMLRVFVERYPEYDQNIFESAITEFFDSTSQIEDYLALIDDEELKKFTLELAKKGASADGLALMENIALEKVYMLWGVEHNA